MAGLARAATITVDTLSSTSVSGHCNLSDAITAANTTAGVQACAAGTGTDTIVFQTGLIGGIDLVSTLPDIVSGETVTITGPTGSPGITLEGGGHQVTKVDSGATLTLQNLTIADGSASLGGAINNSGTLTVTNSTFSNNQASNGFGGGIYSEGTLKVTNSTFSGNEALQGGTGGAIHNEGTVSLKGNILAASTGGNCGGKAVTDVGYNISDDNSCGFSSPSVNNSTTLHLDPAGLQNNGGPTQTIALEPNSQAIDFIPVADCTDQSSPTALPLMNDQRGLPRPDPSNLNFCDAGAFELQTTPFVLAPNSERLQIARSTTPISDQVNLAFTFTENGFPTCDAADDAFNGIDVSLLAGSCETHDHTGLFLSLDSWVVHTVNHVSYGTLFLDPLAATVSARMVELPMPAAPACGEWTLNIEIAGVDSAPLGNGPFSLVLENPDGDQGCFDITNAIVGMQIPVPIRGVRRGVRR